MKNLLITILLSITNTIPAMCTLVVDNGNWSSASSWDCGYIPASDGDTMVIPSSMTVVVDLNSPTYVDMRIEVYGTMQFSNGKKINMDSDGTVEIYTGGTLTGGNSGSPVINGDGELIGTAFDGNWEAMSGDIFFEDQLQQHCKGRFE